MKLELGTRQKKKSNHSVKCGWHRLVPVKHKQRKSLACLLAILRKWAKYNWNSEHLEKLLVTFTIILIFTIWKLIHFYHWTIMLKI